MDDYFETLEYLSGEAHSTAAELGQIINQELDRGEGDIQLTRKQVGEKLMYHYKRMKELSNHLVSVTKKIKNLNSKN